MKAGRRTVVLSALLVAACADLTAPSGNVTRMEATGTQMPRVEVNPPMPAPAPAPAPPPAPTPPPAAAQAEQVRASHILVSFKGATRAKPEITRTKEEARKRAEDLAIRAKKGLDFAELAKQFSDGPTGPRGGDLGKFTADRMVKPFSDAAFALKPGGISDVVETQFGFHVIKRTE